MNRFCIVLFFAIVSAGYASAQVSGPNTAHTAAYLEQIRANTAMLQSFFHSMPKGGDLHNHFSGAVYAETFFDSAVSHHYHA